MDNHGEEYPSPYSIFDEIHAAPPKSPKYPGGALVLYHAYMTGERGFCEVCKDWFSSPTDLFHIQHKKQCTFCYRAARAEQELKWKKERKANAEINFEALRSAMTKKAIRERRARALLPQKQKTVLKISVGPKSLGKCKYCFQPCPSHSIICRPCRSAHHRAAWERSSAAAVNGAAAKSRVVS